MSSTRARYDNVIDPIVRDGKIKNNEQRTELVCFRATAIVIVVLFVCGILAYAINAGIWHFYDNYIEIDNDSNSTTYLSTTTTSAKMENRCMNDKLVSGKRIIGYFPIYESREITISQLSRLTHAVYTHLSMNVNGTIQFNRIGWKNRFLGLAKNAKIVEPNVKVLFSIGPYVSNWLDFSDLLDDPKLRRDLINAIISFIKEHQIDGVDVELRWPNKSDKFKYSAFIQELRQRLKQENENYILSIQAPAFRVSNLDDVFAIDEIVDHVDFVNVFSTYYCSMAYGKLGIIAGPSSPLYSGIQEMDKSNVDHTMKYYSCKTMQPGKFNIVISFETTCWRNVTEAVHPENEMFRHVESQVSITLPQRSTEHEKWKSFPVIWDETTKSSYKWNPENKTYLTFETDKSIKAKMDYVNEKNLGGIWILSVDMDDENNTLLDTLCSNKFLPTTDEKTVRYGC